MLIGGVELGCFVSRTIVALMLMVAWSGCDGGDAGSVVQDGPGSGLADQEIQPVFEIHDAFAIGTTMTPCDAYCFAIGEAIKHSGG